MIDLVVPGIRPFDSTSPMVIFPIKQPSYMYSVCKSAVRLLYLFRFGMHCSNLFLSYLLTHIIGNYVFCDHCNKRVAKKTFHEHRRLGQLRSTCLQTDLVSKEPFVTGRNSTQLDSGDSEQSVVAGLDDEKYTYSSDEQERSALFDDEDQVFFSDNDEIESAVPCSNGYVKNGEVSGTRTTTFAIVIFTCLPNLNTQHIHVSMLHIGVGLSFNLRRKKYVNFKSP